MRTQFITKRTVLPVCLALIAGVVGKWTLFRTDDGAASPYSKQTKYIRNDGRLMDSLGFRSNSSTDKQVRILYTKQFTDGHGLNPLEEELIEGYAKENQLRTVWIELEQPWELLPALYQGHGDIILSQGYDIGGGLRGLVDYTLPWASKQSLVISRDNDVDLKSIDNLSDRHIVIKSSHISKEMAAVIDDLQQRNIVQVLDDGQSEKAILEKVLTGEYDLAIMDKDLVETYAQEMPRLKSIFTLDFEADKVWAVSKNNTQLKDSLNSYLVSELYAINEKGAQPRNLHKIKDSGVLRAISYLSPTNMYYQDGELKGFEYELLKAFAENNNLDLAIVFAKTHGELFDLLEQGEGDVIAASISNIYDSDKTISASQAYSYSAPVIISRDNEQDLIDINDLDGKVISLPKESSYVASLEKLKEKTNIDFTIDIVDESVNTEALLFMVSIGIKDFTVIPSNAVTSELNRQINLKANMHLTEPQGLVWYTRSKDTQLLAEINNFISKEYRKLRFNEIRKKYVLAPNQLKGDEKLLTRIFNLTPYDNYIKRYSNEHGFDWRLIAAQIYQESQFDPRAVSNVGAEGLMQIMPKTAEELGLQKTSDPNQNIEAGVRYLAELRDRFEGDLTFVDQLWFALAAYNAGYNRVKRARKLANEMGLDSDIWFNNVELAMKALSKKRKSDNSLYCRCGQTVVYVRDIRTRYENYIAVTDTAKISVTSRSPVRIDNNLL